LLHARITVVSTHAEHDLQYPSLFGDSSSRYWPAAHTVNAMQVVSSSPLHPPLYWSEVHALFVHVTHWFGWVSVPAHSLSRYWPVVHADAVRHCLQSLKTSSTLNSPLHVTVVRLYPAGQLVAQGSHPMSLVVPHGLAMYLPTGQAVLQDVHPVSLAAAHARLWYVPVLQTVHAKQALLVPASPTLFCEASRYVPAPQASHAVPA
jgi:hypothetical protein